MTSYVLRHKIGPCTCGQDCSPESIYYQAPVYGPYGNVDEAWDALRDAAGNFTVPDWECLPLQPRLPISVAEIQRIVREAVYTHCTLNVRAASSARYTVYVTGRIPAIKDIRTSLGCSLSEAVALVNEMLERPTLQVSWTTDEVSLTGYHYPKVQVDADGLADWERDLIRHYYPEV